jgi:TonB family protein
MNRLYAMAIIGVSVLLGTVLPAQTQPALESSQKTTSVAKLFPPAYPPLARAARITGEVRISVHLRQDGSVESAEVIDGHPMLKQAALESARKSEFACAECIQPVAAFSLVYDFEISDGCHFGPHCQLLDSDQPVITQSPGRVVISAAPACLCDPSVTRIRIRSAKCLYL